MPLFQQSVVKKYLNDLDKETLQQRWTIFTSHFHNSTIQQNILNAKEEEYQEGFVRDLFVTVLGYTLNPQPDYNFVLEKKTEADSTKSDGAILQSGKVVGVIELKDTATTDLDKVEKQAFGYKHRHPDCTYIITANFQKLRFYINDAIEYEEFDLFTLTKEKFDLLYLCLAEQTIFKNIPLLIKQASLTQEETVTKKLYADYSGFRKKLFYNITELNPQYSKIELFQKTQKLLDRFLFILFAEDRMLVPANSVRKILQQWQQLKEMDAAQPLYQRFKLYFGYLNTGRQDKEEIFAYNGGLFAADEILDTIKIDDTILYDSCFALSNYDFQTEIDVNILGHIFEHSLNEIEELQAEAEGKPIDKAKTKRKKDGVFYTPRYITKYIVANTVGALCEQKKQELSINEEVFIYRKQKDKKREMLVKLLDDYRNWLLHLTICDPACGSGAFLNQALEFLITEHRHIDELKANLFGDAFVLTDLDNEILERNLFGVDINEEAVEIARLSLWLRTAKKDRKLSSLTDHIQCGNSLIDDPAVAGDKAFNWQKAFPKIFENGGFDVVIGNPPYVPIEMISEEDKTFFKLHYPLLERKYDLSVIFILKSIKLVAKNGLLSFISSVTWQTGENYKKFREFLVSNKGIIEIINLPFDVFADAYVDTCTYILSNAKNEYYKIKNFSKSEKIVELSNIDFEKISLSEIIEPDYKLILNPESNSLTKKFEKLPSSVRLGDITISTQGLSGSKFEKLEQETQDSFPFLLKGQAYRYVFDVNELSHVLLSNYPSLKNFYGAKPKLLIRRLISRQDRLLVTYTEMKLVFTKDINPFIVSDDRFNTKFLLAVLCSKLMSYLYINSSTIATKDDFRQTTLGELRNITIPLIDNSHQLPFIAKADIMLAKNKELQELKQQLLQLLQSNFPEMQLSKKLEQWPSLSFAELLKELGKQKIKPTLPQQSEWMNYFDQQKAKALALQTIIDTTDTEIDAMVYALYGLTNEEIQIVEGNEKE